MSTMCSPSLYLTLFLSLCLSSLLTCFPSSSLSNNNNNNNNNKSSPFLCHPAESSALLHFINSLTINYSSYDHYFRFSYPIPNPNPFPIPIPIPIPIPNPTPIPIPNPIPIVPIAKKRGWKEGRDCCGWVGVTCHPLSHHVIHLDLTNSGLTGIIHSNNTLFSLRYLHTLNLALNDFSSSPISPNFGMFPHLKYLNLSYSSFTGQVPPEMAQLSKLHSLDLSGNVDLNMPNCNIILANMTELKELDLSFINLDSTFPPSLTNFSSLINIKLARCKLRGELPANILNLPRLNYLDVGWNEGLYAKFQLSNWSSLLQHLDLTGVNLSSMLSSSVPQPQSLPLSYLALTNCSLFGPIPAWLWNSSVQINLAHNQLTGNLPSSLHMSKPSYLTSLYLFDNLLQGEIPSWLLNLESSELLMLSRNHFTSLSPDFPQNTTSIGVKYVLLGYNNLSGNISLDKIFTNLPNLQGLSLSNSGLSVITTNRGVESPSTFPRLSFLGLSACDILEFPNFLKTQVELIALELSHNNIRGEVPKWIWQVGKRTLEMLDLSHNHLTGSLTSLPWSTLVYVDLSSNMFEGLLPIPPIGIEYFSASNNKFTGPLPSSICDLTSLAILDLSNNSLKGNFPHCLGNMSNYLNVLNLGLNNIHGTLPTKFSKGCSLQYLDLSNNGLQGLVPRSLALCEDLQVLNLKSNKLRDEFPYWLLGNLSNIQVLDLSSNAFYGPVTHSKANYSFPMLQILDLSNNNLSGKILGQFINNFKAMMKMSEYNEELQYMQIDGGGYNFSMTLMFNGVPTKYERVITSLFTFDLSNNAFEGEIPECIGQLVSIRGLNLSHNRFTGSIPRSISNLRLLDCLDLSVNMLTGEIPEELTSLTYLGVFNVSKNQLVGPIPHGKNFDTFSMDSYEGNLGLCSAPLPECGEDGMLGQQTSTGDPKNDDDEEVGMLSEWKIIMMGCGCGIVVGLAWGYYMLSVGKPFWLVKLVHLMELAIVNFYER